jgi:signal transduction histidine kinase/CheY-like chemotaxis protein
MQSFAPDPENPANRPPPFWLGLTISLIAVAFVAYMRLEIFPDRVFPLSSSLPLLLCLWSRDLRLLYGMAISLSVITLLKVFVILPGNTGAEIDSVHLASQFLNIWIVVAVVHSLLNARERIRVKNQLLRESNHELEAQNEELAAREEEIARQNEELQSQTEELEQQTEELRQQAEEMEQQSTELQETNLELARREKGMHTLLDSGRWLRSDLNEEVVLSGVCQATIQVLGDDAHAAAVVENLGGHTNHIGKAGFGIHGAMDAGYPFSQSFASLILDRGQTGYLQNIGTRPDILLPRPATGRPYSSVLATPIWLDGRAVAVLEIYSRAPRHWSEQEFRIVEWLAAQAALTLQTVRFQRELQLKRGEAEEASLQKTRFLAAVSHDVRTPANAISLLAELIERISAVPDRSHEVPTLARNLVSNARSLVDLVSDVLDLARFDSGRMDLQVAEFSLCELIHNETAQARPMAETKGLQLIHATPAEDIRLLTDRVKLQRVLSNLIGNAVKFTERGRIEVRCERDAITGEHQLIIEDTGVGIGADHLPRIFDEFHQLGNPERDREKGSGLGLAICRRLLDGLGCKVHVKSSVGIGTTFIVSLAPAMILASRPAATEDPINGHAQKETLENLRILLVEDHETTRETMSQLLTEHGAHVTSARNGREALRLLPQAGYDVLLLDLNLPDIDGSEVLNALRHSRPPGLRRILVLSGDARPERIEEVKRLGADDMLPKPLRIENVIAALQGGATDATASSKDGDVIEDGLPS